MLILAFDTATPAVTVALGDGSGVLAHRTADDARRHGELLAPFISQVLAQAGAGISDLTAIAVGTGPGPYTGLRVGLVTAQVLGSTLGVPVHGICSLDVIAAGVAGAAGAGDFLVATDARRREVYWARYKSGGTRLSGPEVSLPALLPVGLPVAGQGPELYPALLTEPIEPRFPDAAVLASMAAVRIKDGTEPGPARPLYLRRPDAREPGPPKRVTP